MELIAAMNIVRALHLGKSPETDEPLPPGSICLQEDVKERWKWLLERLTWSANQKNREQSVPNRESLGLPTKTLNWRESSIRHSRSARRHKAHGRSQWAINRRLERLGKIPPLATCGAARVIGSGWERVGIRAALPARELADRTVYDWVTGSKVE